MLHFYDLVGKVLVVTVEEVAQVHHYVHLVGTCLHGEGGVGYLDGGVGLSGGETAGDNTYIHACDVKVGAHHFGEVAVDANGGDMVILGILVVEFVYATCEAGH